MSLKKELSLFTATLYGVGIILGAGIYVLLGMGAGEAGNAIWLSFVVAAFIAAFTGLSYAELAGMFPRDAAEYVYTRNAFGRESVSFVVQWIMIFTLIVSASTVALGFGNYFFRLFGVAPVISAAIAIVFLSAINYIGIKESARFNVVATLVEASGLLVVIAVGAFFFRGGVDFFASPSGLTSVLSATTLIFFAYLGFEELVNLSEETKNASKIIPKALILSLGISTIMYILVSISAVGVIGAEALAASPAPMTSVLEKAVPNAGFVMSIIALFATANTALVILIVASRMIYGLSSNNTLPKVLGIVGRRKTPQVAVAVVMVMSLIFLSTGGIKTVALLTDVGLFIVYIFINASVIALRYKAPDAKRTFITPLRVGRMPILPILGILSSFLMFLHFEPVLIIYEMIVIALGALFYRLYSSNRVKRTKTHHIQYLRKAIRVHSKRKHVLD